MLKTEIIILEQCQDGHKTVRHLQHFLLEMFYCLQSPLFFVFRYRIITRLYFQSLSSLKEIFCCIQQSQFIAAATELLEAFY